MSEIETLTEEERATIDRHFAEARADELRGSVSDPLVDEEVRKLLRIHDAQAKRILDLEALLAHLQEDLSKNLFIRDETRAKQGKRISELEAQVLASDTVGKVEYAAMVKQRDTMREDLKAARHLLNDALDWLEAQAEGVDGGLIEQIRALPPFRA